MQWPTMSDYQDAMQSPRVSFADQDLKRGLPVTDRLGLPRPITGGFASVYQVVSGGNKWAVRCFLRHHLDSEERYAAISRALSSARLPYVIGFQYVKQGIRIKSQWYPILKMEWVDGEPLNAYVSKHRTNPSALRDLAAAFACMSEELRAKSIAHGDLQHGNILVVGGRLKLVDYDCMYVPGLRGLPSHELGHPNYQHPMRSEGDFGPYLDAFSEWVIYVSLAALSVRPDLWDTLQVGDEQLLFSQRDFVNPAGSRVLRVMDESGDPVLQALSSAFRQVIVSGDVSRIPPPDASADPSELPSMIRRSSQAKGVFGNIAKMLWLPPAHERVGQESAGASTAGEPSPAGAQDAVAQAAAGTGAAAQSGQAGASLPAVPSWVKVHLQPAPVKLSPPFTADRMLVAGYLALAFGLFRFQAAGYFSAQIALSSGAAGFAFLAAALTWKYVTRHEFQRKKVLVSGLRAARRRAKRVESAVKNLERERERVLARQQKSVDNIEARLKGLVKSEQEEHSWADAWLKKRLAAMAEKREELNKAEADELTQAAKGTAIPLLAKKATSIIKYYRRKRESLLRQEERAKTEAQRKHDSIRVRNSRHEQVFHKKLAEVRLNYGQDVGVLNTKIGDENTRLLECREAEADLRRELKTYSGVSFAVYLRRIVFLP